MATRNIRQSHNNVLQDLDVAGEYLYDAFESEDPAIILMALHNIAETLKRHRRSGGKNRAGEDVQTALH